MSALSGTRLGIDANNYLRRLLTPRDPTTSDAFLAAVGGAPLTLTAEVSCTYQRWPACSCLLDAELTASVLVAVLLRPAFVQIEKDLKALERAGVKPVFVFSGVNPQERDRPFMMDDPRNWRRAQAWEHYEQGRVPQAQADFGSSNSVLPTDVMRIVHRLFKQRSVEFVVAPYLAWAQLVYLERHERAYVHSIYGSNELFMFDGVDRIILDINFASATISFASKSAIIADMGLNSDQFLDLAILAGFESSPTFPAIDPREFNLRSVVELMKQRGTGIASVIAFKDFPPVFQTNYLDTYARSRSMIKYSLVLVAQEGRVLPLPLVVPPPASHPSQVITAADVPLDLSEIFSSRFPDEVYYQLFRGLVSPSVIAGLASGRITEPTPLCGGTAEYERYIKTLVEHPQSPRAVAVSLVSSVLHPLWQKKPVVSANASRLHLPFADEKESQSVIYYFDPAREYPVPHTSLMTHQFIESVSKWNADARHVEDELRRQLVSPRHAI